MISTPVALITGSGKRRVGWHIADALARRGYRLAIHYRSSADDANRAIEEFRDRGVEAIAVRADLTDAPAVAELVQTVHTKFGRIDVLVNAAADWKPKKLEDITADDVNHYFQVNTLGTFLCAQHAGLIMAKQDHGGVILNIGDWATVRPYLNYAAYFASKGSIPTLTRTLAVELGTRNPRVRVNAILPGPVMLPPDLSQAERDEAIAGTLVKREGTPGHVAHAALFLIDNDFVTGVCLAVDGGRSIYAPEAP